MINSRKVDMEPVLKTKINILPSDAKGREEYVVLTIASAWRRSTYQDEFFGYLLHVQKQFCLALGFGEKDLRFRQVLPPRGPHYSKGNIDVEARFENG